jgi:hypothetical protein
MSKQTFPQFTKEKIDSIDLWKEHVINFCKGYLIDHGHFQAMAFWINIDNKVNAAISCNQFMGSGASKDHLVSYLKLMSDLTKPNAMIFVSESWFLKQKYIKGKKLPDSIADHPNRTEALMVAFETQVTGKIYIFDIIRPTNRDKVMGKKMKFELFNLPDNVKFTGRFTDLLHKPIKSYDN